MSRAPVIEIDGRVLAEASWIQKPLLPFGHCVEVYPEYDPATVLVTSEMEIEIKEEEATEVEVEVQFHPFY